VYWITTNLWTVGQGYILRRRLGPIRPPDQDASAPAKAAEDEPEGARKGVMARLAEATAKQPVTAGAKSGGASTKSAAPAPKPPRSGPPPRPPRKKKKRSGRRR